jgi:GLPGLI family protein
MHHKLLSTMRTLTIFPAILMCAAISRAQDEPVTSGKAVYDEVIKLEIKLEGDASQFADMLPKERKSVKVLYFSPGESLYVKGEAEEENIDQVVESGQAMVQIRMAEPDNKLYTDLDKKTQIEQKEFMTRVFLIEGEVPEQAWKLTGQQKMILGYPCQEATLDTDDQHVSAWFTPAIPVPAGPGEYRNLPGLVLSVDVDQGKRVITARSVEAADPSSLDLAKPKKGKKLTQEEFDAIVAEKLEEMGGEHGEGGNVQMMIRIEQ